VESRCIRRYLCGILTFVVAQCCFDNLFYCALFMTTITVSVNNKTMIMLTGSKPVDGTVSPDLHRAG